jgi:hypothetical protein
MEALCASRHRRAPERRRRILDPIVWLEGVQQAVAEAAHPVDRRVAHLVGFADPVLAVEQHTFTVFLDREDPEIEFGQGVDVVFEEEADVVAAVVAASARHGRELRVRMHAVDQLVQILTTVGAVEPEDEILHVTQGANEVTNELGPHRILYEG